MPSVWELSRGAKGQNSWFRADSPLGICVLPLHPDPLHLFLSPPVDLKSSNLKSKIEARSSLFESAVCCLLFVASPLCR